MNYETIKATYLPRLKELGGAALIAVLMGCSMSLTLLDALAVSFSVWQAVLTSALTALICVGVLLGRVTALASTVCVGGGLAFAIIRHGSLMEIIKETTVSLLTILVGGEGSLNEHALFLMLTLTIFFTLMAFLLSRLSGGVYPALLMYLFVMLGGWYLEKRLIPAYIVPGLVAMAVLYARAHRETGGYIRAIPAALIAALLAVALIPSGEVTWKPLSDAAGKVRELFTDYFMFTDPRTVYSVSSDGYQPQGEILGGPAEPRDAEIMTVKTDRLLMVRGSVRRTYTGYSWVDNSFNSRYLFIDPTRAALRDTVFDVDLATSLDGLLTGISGEVAILNKGTSTLFVPHRLKSLSLPLDLVAYYNDSGEVFITRGVEYGDHYSFEAYVITGDQKELNARIRSVVPGSDPDYYSIQDGYMNLPAGLDNDVYWLTQDIIKDAETPYEKALAIQQHLLNGYTYRLDVELPPQGRDFVSHFLLDTKEGYCTYYASAMAVMARLAGLPSRYVEGYLVPSEPDGETLVTGDNAHAWVEIYFEGIGWIPFDATPGDQVTNDGQSNTPPEDEPTPTPTATPSPTPSPSPTPDRGDADEPDPGHDDATATPAPTATPEPENADSAVEPTATPEPPDATPDPGDGPEDSPERQAAFRILRLMFLLMGILLLLLLLTILLIRRLRRTDPRRLAARQKNDRMKLMVWYRAILTLLMRSGFVPEGGETPEQFAIRTVAADAAPEKMIELAQMIERQQYAREKAIPGSVKLAREVYERLVLQMRPADRLRWHMHRLLHGFGDFNQIP